MEGRAWNMPLVSTPHSLRFVCGGWEHMLPRIWLEEFRTCHLRRCHFDIMIILNCRPLKSESHSVMSDSVTPELYSPWNSPGQNTGVGSLFLIQGIFTTQGLNPGLLQCPQILYQLGHKVSSEPHKCRERLCLPHVPVVCLSAWKQILQKELSCHRAPHQEFHHPEEIDPYHGKGD